MSKGLYYKTKEEIELIRESSLLVAKTLAEVAKVIKPGVTTLSLDKVAYEFINDNKAIPAFLNYSGFPNSLCISVNSQVVHGIPNNYELRDGDIVSVDCGVVKNNFFGDSAYTFAIGEVKPEVLNLLEVTKESLYKGIEMAVVGKRLGDIGEAVQTDLKKILAALDNKTKELERSNKELEQFAYVASHDLQEPLRTISNYVDLLEEDYSETKNEIIKQYFTFITSASSRMQILIKDLLDFSRVGKNPVFVSVDCNKILKEVIAELESSIKESKAKITFSVLPVVTGIEIELKRVFQNLISNALKFRRKDVVPEIEITSVETESEYVFSIKDNGIGIEEKSKSKLFVIFQRLHPAEEYPGTGIGLATAKKIVDLHKGKIWIESKVNEGSVFYFTIPKENLK